MEVAYASSVDYEIDDNTTTIRVRCRAALPEFEADELKRYAVSGIFSATTSSFPICWRNTGITLMCRLSTAPMAAGTQHGKSAVRSEPILRFRKQPSHIDYYGGSKMLKLSLQFFAHKKGVGSTKNGRDSESKRLGVKRSDGRAVLAGNILVRQRHRYPSRQQCRYRQR